MKTRNTICILICFILLCFRQYQTFAKEIIAEGAASISSPEEKANARTIAIEDALRAAVEKGVGVYLDSNSITKNYQLLEDNIFTNSKGYVTSYDILSEKTVDGMYKIKIKANVDFTDISNDLSALKIQIRRGGNPRIMVIIPETMLQRPKVPDPAAETAIVKKIVGSGYKVIDQNQIKEIRYSESVRKILEGDFKAAQAIGRRFKADIIIVGEAFSESLGNIEGSNLIGCRARLEARAIKVDNAEIVAANSVTKSGADITENIAGKNSLENAGFEMADYFITQITEKLSPSERGLQILISGAKDFKKLDAIESYLNGVNGVKSVYVRDYEEYSGLATLDVDTFLSAFQLSSQLKKIKKPVIKITSVSTNKIEVKVVK